MDRKTRGEDGRSGPSVENDERTRSAPVRTRGDDKGKTRLVEIPRPIAVYTEVTRQEHGNADTRAPGWRVDREFGDTRP